jgi:uncharacterized protein DUF6488
MHYSRGPVPSLVFIITLLLTHLAFGHADHASPLTDDQAIVKATQDVGIIVKESEKIEGKILDESWVKSTEKKIFKKGLRYFVVSFQHPKQKETLYIHLSSFGAYQGANFSGVFEGL